MHREFATTFRRTRPRRSYKNFGLFCLAHGSSFGNPYPCLACRGQGTVYDPEDPPCPVEGNKYRRTIRCAACGGRGKGTKEACRQAYQKDRRSVPPRERRVRPARPPPTRSVPEAHERRNPRPPGARTVSETLRQLRARVKRESPYVGIRPYSHNIIRLTLAEIDKRFGRPAANKAVRDFNLAAKGFNEEPEHE